MKKERRGKEDSNLSKSDLLRGLFKAIYVTINTFVFNFDVVIYANYNLENIVVELDIKLVVYYID